jgi:hypothetical protein
VYALGELRPIPDDCRSAVAVLTAVPETAFAKPDFDWHFAKQVFAANPQFQYAKEFDPGRTQVNFIAAEHIPTKGRALVAQCTKGADCNQVAAAYKTVVPSSRPEVVCGKAPTLGGGEPTLESLAGPDALKKAVPDSKDVVEQCVRLAACRAARDRRLDGDPAIACQKKPNDFKLSCAAKFPCSAVLACTGE